MHNVVQKHSVGHEILQRCFPCKFIEDRNVILEFSTVSEFQFNNVAFIPQSSEDAIKCWCIVKTGYLVIHFIYHTRDLPYQDYVIHNTY